jgi:hypothetical protein
MVALELSGVGCTGCVGPIAAVFMSYSFTRNHETRLESQNVINAKMMITCSGVIYANLVNRGVRSYDPGWGVLVKTPTAPGCRKTRRQPNPRAFTKFRRGVLQRSRDVYVCMKTKSLWECLRLLRALEIQQQFKNTGCKTKSQIHAASDPSS